MRKLQKKKWRPKQLVHKYIKRKRLEKGAVELWRVDLDARNRVLQLTYFDIAFWDYFRLGQHSSSSLAELSI